MTSITYTPREYQSYIAMSSRKHLLVEGRDDKRLFEIFLDALLEKGHQVIVDTAEFLIQCQNSGNRSKVEEICTNIIGKPYESKMVGFVDREYREFEIGEQIDDHLGQHKVANRVIWSRGHSIENYFFDMDVMEEPLRSLALTEHFRPALTKFRTVMPSAIIASCALGLLSQQALQANEIHHLNAIRAPLSYKTFDIQASVSLNHGEFEASMKKVNFSDTVIADWLEKYELWVTRLSSCDISVARWLCHGHIGFDLLWKIYYRCVYEAAKSAGAANPDAEARKAQAANTELKTNICIEAWVRQCTDGNGTYPQEMLAMLKT